MNISISLDDADGLNLLGTVKVSVAASPEPLKVEYFLDNAMVYSDTVSPYVWPWDTTAAKDGTHIIRAEAVYKTRRQKAQEAVTVNNTIPVPPAPVYKITITGDPKVGQRLTALIA